MSDGFTQMIATSRKFLGDLTRNNDRDWFEDHKKTFKTEIEAPLKLLTDLFADDISQATGRNHTGKVGRIYRDVRFSKDKSPYNTHVHAYWMPTNGNGPGWLLQIDAEGAKLMTGMHALDADGLVRYRNAVDCDGDALRIAITDAESRGAAMIDFGDTSLKRVPKAFDQDHPHSDLIRRKQIVLGIRFDNDLQTDVIPALKASVAILRPFWNWCNGALD
ncbi:MULTISPECIES: DUF2461 domain-containing protein [unclassified Yoonia]|uniref:DUF2461 domain-containing protein n=1 Tax=unclassified Yoonia TaxID=2629118 RepID=UPI002AFE8B89|nr:MULTISPECIES: DUF2461 domain-containing protein [unclassified Yoonia]